MKISLFLLLFSQVSMLEYSFCSDSKIQSILEKALNFQKESKWDSAQFYFIQTLSGLKDENNYSELSNVYRSMGNGFIRQAQYDSATAYIKKSIQTAKTNVNDPNIILTKGYNSLAIIWGLQGQYLKAGDNFKLALKYHLADDNSNLKLTAKLYNNIGAVFERISLYDSAIVYFEKSLNIKKEIYGTNNKSIGNTYNNIGILNHARGNFQEAVHYFTRALNTKDIESIPQSIADIYHNLGMVYADMGELDLAETYIQKSILITSEKINPNHENVAINTTTLGRLEEQKGNYNSALDLYQEAVRNFTEFNPDSKTYLATTYNNVGYVYELIDNHIQALVYYIKALEIYNSQDKAYSNTALTQANIGRMYLLSEDYQNALLYANKALKLREELFGEIHPLVAASHKLIGDVFINQGDIEAALDYYQDACDALSESFVSNGALSIPKVNEVNSKLVYLEVIAGRVAALIQKAETAENNTEKIKYLSAGIVGSETAVDLISQIRRNYLFSESKFVLAKSSDDIYKLGIQSAVKLFEVTRNDSYIRQAFQYSELSRSGVLWEALQASDAQQFKGVPNEVTNREDDLKREMTYLQNELVNEEEKDEQNREKLNQLHKLHFLMLTEYDNLMKTIRNDYPDYYRLKFPERNINYDKIKNALEKNEMLIEYFLGVEKIYIFSIINKKLDLSTIPKPENIADLVVEFNRSIKKMKMEKLIQIGGQLYDLLIHPLEKKLKRVKKLTIIPSGVLNNLPFEVLIRRKKNGSFDTIAYLVKDFEISYNFSGDFLYKGKESKIDKSRNFIGFAPVHNFANYYDSNNELPALKGTEDELSRISNMYSNHAIDASVILRQSATEAQFKQISFDEFEILHIATHGILNHEHPELSALVFYDDSSISEDGLLYGSEVYNLNLGSELVVLSSCDSGVGKMVTGEGMLSLARGFMYAGSDNIIYTLWRVGDKVSSEMMSQFYRFVLSGNDYSSALRQAKLEMLKNEETAMPRNWGGFVLMGS